MEMGLAQQGSLGEVAGNGLLMSMNLTPLYC